jgi:hypothetical protein
MWSYTKIILFTTSVQHVNFLLSYEGGLVCGVHSCSAAIKTRSYKSGLYIYIYMSFTLNVF